MKKLVFLLLLLSAASGEAQNTTVTALVTDRDGTAWFSGNWKIDFHPNNSVPGEGNYRLINGQPLSGAVTHQNGVTDASGNLSVTVYDSTLITPTGSGWTLTMCPNASATCGVYQFSTAGGSMNISSNLTAVIPAPRFEATGTKAFGYVDIEAMVRVSTGGCYWNVTSNAQRCWNGTQFVNAAGNPGVTPGGNPGELQINNGTANLGAASGVTYDGNGGLLAANGALAGKSMGGSCYAKQWQTPAGTGNNGIQNAMANCTAIIADSTYAPVEKPGPFYFNTSPVYYNDTRIGQSTEFFVNPQVDPSQWYWFNMGFVSANAAQAGKRIQCLYTQQSSYWPNGSSISSCLNLGFISNAPGWSYGNTGAGGLGFPTIGCGFVSTLGTQVTFQSATSGCTNGFRTDGSWVGQPIQINKVMYTISSVTSSTQLILTSPAGTQTNSYYYVMYGSGWSINYNSGISSVIRGRGISEGTFTAYSSKWGVGDNATQYIYNNGGNGVTAPSDEAQKALSLSVNADMGQYSSTITCPTGGCTTGMTQIKAALANSNQGTGRYLFQSGTPFISGNVTAFTAARNGTAVTVDTTVPVSNAWGTLNYTTYTPGSTIPPTFATPTQITVTLTSGAFVPNTAGGNTLVCFQGNFHEQVQVPALVNAPVGGVQTLTLPLRNPHAAGTYVYQGGACGAGLEMVSNTMGSTPLYYFFDAVGSVDPNTIQIQMFAAGSGIAPPNLALAPYATLTALSSSGTTVTGTYSGPLTAQLRYYGKATFNISGSSDSALNGPCTNAVFSTLTTFTCTNSTLSGTHTPSAPLGIATIGTNAFNLWQMAEVLDVQNYSFPPPCPGYTAGNSPSTCPPQVDGTLTLEPNNIAFSNGGTVIETNHITERSQIMTGFLVTQNPYTYGIPYEGISIQAGGNGVVGGGPSPAGAGMLNMINQNPVTYYQGGGGWRQPFNGINFQGPYSSGIEYGYLPMTQGNSFIHVGAVATAASFPPVTDVNYNYYLYRLYDGTIGETTMQVTPATAAVNYATNGPVSYNGTSHTFTGGPVNLSASSTVGGTSILVRGTVVKGTLSLPTTLLASGSCYANTTATATGALTSDTVTWSFVGAPDATWGEMIMHPYTAVNLVGFQICNPPGGAGVTPVAATLNWTVTR